MSSCRRQTFRRLWTRRPKAAVVKRYDTGHDVFQSKAAEQEMLTFLSSKLGAGPRVQGAEVGP